MLCGKRELCRVLSSGWLAPAAVLRMGCQGQGWSRKTSQKWRWLSQNGSSRNAKEWWWDSGKLGVETTESPAAWDAECGRKGSICGGWESWPEELTRRTALLSAEMQGAFVCFPTSVHLPLRMKSQLNRLE